MASSSTIPNDSVRSVEGRHKQSDCSSSASRSLSLTGHGDEPDLLGQLLAKRFQAIELLTVTDQVQFYLLRLTDCVQEPVETFVMSETPDCDDLQRCISVEQWLWVLIQRAKVVFNSQWNHDALIGEGR